MPQADRGMSRCRRCHPHLDSESEARYCSHYSSFKFPSQKDASILFVDFARDLDTDSTTPRDALGLHWQVPAHLGPPVRHSGLQSFDAASIVVAGGMADGHSVHQASHGTSTWAHWQPRQLPVCLLLRRASHRDGGTSQGLRAAVQFQRSVCSAASPLQPVD